ncbi:ABC transporter ATP-binding protein [Rhizobium leguminosarum]|uniref:ABC transporter ATP-binding protein n=1 Tax=Rhizobium leguminosarum TaxID=384 RepID=UPI001C959DA6|nr:ABC transporter ATP-binding protein [Rhizobium leguminosarum]
MTTVLSTSALSVVYRTQRGNTQALDKVDVQVDQGEIVGLVGETGCGKTTLARAILGTLPKSQAEITGGCIKLEGVDTRELALTTKATGRRAITVVPQDPYASLNPLFRIGTQMADLQKYVAPQKPAGWFGSRRRRWDDNALEMFDTVQLAGGREILLQYPHQLSGGQRQRVMLAMALLPEPKIIIADEPTAALDASIQAQILGLFRKVASQQRIGMLFTTHDLGAAWEICDRVVVMHGGRVIESAPRGSFFFFPRHPHSRRILATASRLDREHLWTSPKVTSQPMPLSGCQFSPRCPRSSEMCREVCPALEDKGSEHRVACHNPWTDEVAFAYD